MGNKRYVVSFYIILGITVSRVYQDQFYASLASEIVQTVIHLLSQEICRLMVFGNFQQGNHLREQWGGKSSKFLIGTTEATHRVNPFLNFTWDHWKIELTYTLDQIVPSPLGMQLYETMDLMPATLGTDLFTNHHNILISLHPCFVGVRVEVYETAICLC